MNAWNTGNFERTYSITGFEYSRLKNGKQLEN